MGGAYTSAKPWEERAARTELLWWCDTFDRQKGHTPIHWHRKHDKKHEELTASLQTENQMKTRQQKKGVTWGIQEIEQKDEKLSEEPSISFGMQDNMLPVLL